MRARAIFAGMVLTTSALAALPGQTAMAATTWTGTYSQAIALLPVATEVRTGYDRTLFKTWIDADKDCQNTRAEVLLAESSAPVTFTTTSNCTVATGRWLSWFDGLTFDSATLVSIDHMIPLAEAWDSGASAWTSTRRQDFANDLGDARELNAVSASINSSKGDRDPTDWLPPRERCRYLTEWVAVKARWALSVDAAEQATLLSWALTCGDPSITVTLIDGLPTTDTQAPTAPGNLVATATGPTSVSLQWTASTDNVGVTGYQVSRDGTALGSALGTSYMDSATQPATTYTYAVRAMDAAGNISSATTVSVTTPAAGLTLLGSTRIVGTSKYADLSWTGGQPRWDLWRGGSRLLWNTTVRSTTNQVKSTVKSATYIVCPTGLPTNSPACSSVTLTW